MKKKLCVLGVCAFAASLSGNVLAGEGCLGYKHGELAKLDGPVVEQNEVDPALLALLKKQQASQLLEMPEGSAVVHN